MTIKTHLAFGDFGEGKFRGGIFGTLEQLGSNPGIDRV